MRRSKRRANPCSRLLCFRIPKNWQNDHLTETLLSKKRATLTLNGHLDAVTAPDLKAQLKRLAQDGHTQLIQRRLVEEKQRAEAERERLLEGESLRVARWRGYEAFGGEELVSSLVQTLTDLTVDAEVIQSRQPLVILNTEAAVVDACS